MVTIDVALVYVDCGLFLSVSESLMTAPYNFLHSVSLPAFHTLCPVHRLSVSVYFSSSFQPIGFSTLVAILKKDAMTF